MALGSAIGTGLFYGSAKAIQQAGPSVLIAYLLAGAAGYMVMRALGEMAVHNPVPGPFGQYASDYPEIGRASCRGKGEISVGAGSLKKKNNNTTSILLTD